MEQETPFNGLIVNGSPKSHPLLTSSSLKCTRNIRINNQPTTSFSSIEEQPTRLLSKPYNRASAHKINRWYRKITSKTWLKYDAYHDYACLLLNIIITVEQEMSNVVRHCIVLVAKRFAYGAISVLNRSIDPVLLRQQQTIAYSRK
uniref:DDE_Tnp_1_7 domain-containing protein n=1 Tax=Heterorhabditis bacteriophora TaxID=37862 RepID=A0A1I7WSS4_HETBA